jgi:PIN domain nuclease of toxin-antitoxin system
MTLWELAHLMTRGRIRSIGSIEASVRKLTEGYTIKELTLEIAALAAQFPPDFPGDPVDRIIGATARVEGMALVTADQRIQASPLFRTIW